MSEQIKNIKPEKLISAAITLLLHVALLLLLLNTYLSREVPQDEAGLEVMLGMDTDGGNDLFEPTPADEIADQLEEVETPAQEPTEVAPSTPEPSEEAHQTQDIEESVKMKKAKSEEELKKEKELAEKKRIEKQKQLEEQKRIAEEKRKKEAEKRRSDSIANAIAQRTKRGFGGNGTGGNGDVSNAQGTGGSSTGTNGNPFGSNTSTNTQGNTNSGNNKPYSLAGRYMSGSLVRPTYSKQVEGKVIISIVVDPSGNVIEARLQSKGTTVDDADVINAAIAAAKMNKFSPLKGSDTQKNQSGTITYNLQLR